MSEDLTVDDILMALPGLPKDQINKIKMTCEFLNKGGKPKHLIHRGTKPAILSREDEEMELLYDVVREHLSRMGIRAAPYPQFTEMSAGYFSTFKRGWVIVDVFLNKHFGGKLRRPDRMKLYNLFVEMVVDDITSSGNRLSLVRVCSGLHSVPGIVLQQFPGYAQAGLMTLVLEWGNRSAGTNVDKD